MYRPKFCADCGARIARARWHWWTSRRFCADCAKRFGRARALTGPLLLVIALFAGGFWAGRAGRPPAPPLIIQRGELTALAEPPATAEASRSATETAALDTSSAASRSVTQGAEREPPTDPQEVISMCGARTQRGRPCSRRVRGTGRCWQHRGMPAMLPAERLIIPPE